MHHKNYLWNEAHSWKAKLSQFPNFFRRWSLHRIFNAFIKENMNLTPISYNGFSSIHADQFPEEAIYIVGSDQIWNYRMTNGDTHYFLDFVKSGHKYAYAASFGGTVFSEGDFMRYKDYLLGFKGIGIREESGKQMLEKWAVKSETVCDPTLLLSRDQWLGKATKTKVKGKYVLLYLLNKNSKLIHLAKDFAQRNGLPLLNIAYSVKNIPEVVDIRNVSPSEWIGYIDNATCVFTDSFHGFLFSLNFEKQIGVGLNGTSRDARIIDVAKRYGAEDCIIDNTYHPEQVINYPVIVQKIAQDKEKSLEYIKKIISNNDNTRITR